MGDIEFAREFQKLVDSVDRIDERTKETKVEVLETKEAIHDLSTNGLPMCKVHQGEMAAMRATIDGLNGSKTMNVPFLGQIPVSLVAFFLLLATAIVVMCIRQEGIAGTVDGIKKLQETPRHISRMETTSSVSQTEVSKSVGGNLL